MASEELKDLGKKTKRVSPIDRMVAEAIAGDREIGLPTDPAKGKFPLLWEWITKTCIGKDYVKQPARISVTMGPEGFIASVSDTDLAQSLTATGAHLEDCFQALETALELPNPPFVAWGKKQPTLRKRKPIS